MEERVEVVVVSDALMWEEPSPVTGERPIQRAEFKGWRGTIPFSVAVAKGREVRLVEDGEVLDEPPPVATTGELAWMSMKVEDIISLVNQTQGKAKMALAGQISTWELTRPRPRQTLTDFLDTVLAEE